MTMHKFTPLKILTCLPQYLRETPMTLIFFMSLSLKVKNQMIFLSSSEKLFRKNIGKEHPKDLKNAQKRQVLRGMCNFYLFFPNNFTSSKKNCSMRRLNQTASHMKRQEWAKKKKVKISTMERTTSNINLISTF